MGTQLKCTLALATCVALTLAGAPGAGAETSFLGSLSQSMKYWDREMCRKYPTRKCQKQVRLAPVKQEAVKAPIPKSKPNMVAAKTQTASPEKSALPDAVAKTVQPKFGDRIPASEPAEATTEITKAAPAGKVASTEPNPPPAKKIAPPPDAASEDDCLKALAKDGAAFTPVAQPSSKPECHVADPVRLISVDVTGGKVKMSDQPTVACTFAQRLTRWVQTEAAPITYSNLNTALNAMGTGPGFDCRGRNGDSSAKMSEHANGNAVDIEYLKLADGDTLHVRKALDSKGRGFATLRDLRASACKSFTTVLGPGANSAHQEHFHFDLEKRKVAGTYQICQ